MFTLWKDNPLTRMLHLIDDPTHHTVAQSQSCLQGFTIVVDAELADIDTGDTLIDRRFSNRRRLPQQDPLIEWLGDNVIATEVESIHSISARHRLGNRLFC